MSTTTHNLRYSIMHGEIVVNYSGHDNAHAMV